MSPLRRQGSMSGPESTKLKLIRPTMDERTVANVVAAAFCVLFALIGLALALAS
jgi:hypothetical protein